MNPHGSLDRKYIEVVCENMMCFKVDPKTLDPLTCSYYEPAAFNDPRGPQMTFSEWVVKRNEQWEALWLRP